MTKLYIGNLGYSITDQELKEHFEKQGKVDQATVITDRATGRSRGFGFVEMPDDEEANKAIEELNKSTFGDRMMFVSVARSREERPQS